MPPKKPLPKAPKLEAPIHEHKKHAEEVLAIEEYKIKPPNHPVIETDQANP